MTPDDQAAILDEAMTAIAARHPGSTDWRSHAFTRLTRPELQRGRWTVIGEVSRRGATTRDVYTVCVDLTTGERILKHGWPTAATESDLGPES